MTLARELAGHAVRLLEASKSSNQQNADLRRAVSASYYALFHQLSGDATSHLAPHVRSEIQHRIQRWFQHAEMKSICRRFLAERLDQPLLGLIGEQAPEELRSVCRIFIDLQEARHSADYDLSYDLTFSKASDFVKAAMVAMILWERVKNTSEANIFILSLLMWKNWDRERL